jgi:hypothetical protein
MESRFHQVFHLVFVAHLVGCRVFDIWFRPEVAGAVFIFVQILLFYGSICYPGDHCRRARRRGLVWGRVVGAHATLLPSTQIVDGDARVRRAAHLSIEGLHKYSSLSKLVTLHHFLSTITTATTLLVNFMQSAFTAETRPW